MLEDVINPRQIGAVFGDGFERGIPNGVQRGDCLLRQLFPHFTIQPFVLQRHRQNVENAMMDLSHDSGRFAFADFAQYPLQELRAKLKQKRNLGEFRHSNTFALASTKTMLELTVVSSSERSVKAVEVPSRSSSPMTPKLLPIIHFNSGVSTLCRAQMRALA